jgi:hypothetical protein
LSKATLSGHSVPPTFFSLIPTEPLTDRAHRVKILMTTEYPLRGGMDVWSLPLNKITGCNSRTVPPLYVSASRLLVKTGHWEIPGKAEPVVQSKQPLCTGTSQKTYGAGFFHPLRDYKGRVCRRKTAAAPILGAAVFYFQEEFL